jgi:hypothetical protein
MAPMDGNTKSSERSTIQQQASIDPKKSSNAISEAPKTRTVHNHTGDRSTAGMIVWKLYVFFFQYQI